MALLVIAAALVIAYSGVVFTCFAFMDDYFWLNLSLRQPIDVFHFQAAQGRPLNALILQTVFRVAGSLDALRWVRLLTIIETAFVGWIFYLAMIRAGWRDLHATMLAIVACLMPAEQVYMAWATSVPNPWSMLAAAIAAILTGAAIDEPRKKWGLMAVASVLLCISVAIYQPSVMVFWPIAAIDLFRPGRADRLFRRGAIYFVVSCVGLAFGWCAFKFGVSYYEHWAKPERSHLTLDAAGKIGWFLGYPLVDALNMFRIWPNVVLAIAVAVVLIIGLAGYFRNVGAVCVAAILLPLSYLPNLLAPENWSSYRSQVALEWMVLVLSWLAINGIWQTLRHRTPPLILLMAAVIFCGALAGYHVVVFFARPQATELAAFRHEMSRPDVRAADQIYLLQPAWIARLTPFSRYDEFGRTSLQAGWVPQSAVNLVRREFDADAARIPVEIYPDYHGPWAGPLPPGTALIDLRSFGKQP